MRSLAAGVVGCGLALASVACAPLQLWRETSAIEDRWQGRPGPAFVVTTLDGQRLSADELRGRRVVLSFWATWCTVCRYEIPEINQAVREHGSDMVRVIGITSEDPAVVREFLKEQPMDYTVATVAEADLPPPYRDLPAVPATFVLDAAGVIEFVHFGYLGSGALADRGWPG